MPYLCTNTPCVRTGGVLRAVHESTFLAGKNMCTKLLLLTVSSLVLVPVVGNAAVVPVGVPASGNPAVSIVVTEAGKNSSIIITEGTASSFNAAVAVAVGPDNVPVYSTGGIFLAAGDIYWLNPAGVLPTVSDMMRIYPVAGTTTGDTFSVFSLSYLEKSQEDPASLPLPDSPYDVPVLPAGINMAASATVPENGTYVSPAPNGTAGSFTFNSDHDVVPEPGSLALLLLPAACGLLLLQRRTVR